MPTVQQDLSVRFIAIQRGQGFDVVTNYLKNRLDPLVLAKLKLPADTKTTGLTQTEADELVNTANAWLAGNHQPTNKRRGAR